MRGIVSPGQQEERKKVKVRHASGLAILSFPVFAPTAPTSVEETLLEIQAQGQGSGRGRAGGGFTLCRGQVRNVMYNAV